MIRITIFSLIFFVFSYRTFATESGFNRTFQVSSCDGNQIEVVPIYYAADSFNNPDGYMLITSSSLVPSSIYGYNLTASIYDVSKVTIDYQENELPDKESFSFLVTATIKGGINKDGYCPERTLLSGLRKCAECVAADRKHSPISIIFKRENGSILSQNSYEKVLPECIPFSIVAGQQSGRPGAGVSNPRR
jgi:hypothetical protein